MSSIGVVHPDIMAGAGSEAVTGYMLDAIRDHDLTLYTSKPVDFAGFDAEHGTSLETADITVVNPAADVTDGIDLLTAPVKRATSITKFRELKASLVCRALRRQEPDHDLFISAWGQFPTELPSIEYVHARRPVTKVDGYGPLAMHYRLCDYILGDRTQNYESTTTVANSEWMQSQLASAKRDETLVLYPPIDTSDIEPLPWEQRDEGFVSLGRITPTKRQVAGIEIIDSVVDRGVDTHLHVIGLEKDDSYCRRIRQMAAERSYVHFEGEVTRERLVELIVGHRFGLHAARDEPFGMTIAEMAAGGTVPFVHESGGQREILATHPELIYERETGAVESIIEVFSDECKQRSLSDQLVAEAQQFSVDTFQHRFAEVVRQRLEGTPVTVPSGTESAATAAENSRPAPKG